MKIEKTDDLIESCHLCQVILTNLQVSKQANLNFL